MYGFNWFEDENSNVFGALTLATHFLFYWVHGLIVLFVLPKDKIKMYKIQKGKEPDQALINKALLHVGLGHAVAVPVGTYFLTLYMVQDMSFDPAEFEIKSCAFYIVLWHILFDTWFYWTHRAAHHPSIYRFIHKQHHEFYVPVSICAGYAHPLEDLVVNLGSTLIGPILFPSHVYTWAIYYALRMHETVDAHSGYDFPWSPWHYTGWLHGGASRHDWHHSKQRGNYGGFFFWDWLCGTDKGYKRYLAKQEKLKQGKEAPPKPLSAAKTKNEKLGAKAKSKSTRSKSRGRRKSPKKAE